MSTTFQIAEVAQRSGFTAAALRYYEDLGILTPTARTEAGQGPSTGVDDNDAAADDTCGCTSDTTTAGERLARTETAVPLITTPATRSGDAGEAPIACTLAAGEMSSRLEEWQSLLEDKRDLLQGVTARQQLQDGLRLEFAPASDVTEIARLAAAEQNCCRFFRFALIIDDRGVALEVHAPPDGLPVLTALFGAAA
jgi:hypothetical protein